MIRRIIEIDKEKCNGCGLCAKACHEGAIGMVDGKATLLRDDYCDGLGDCLPVCPTGAITFVEREAAAYDEAAVQANMAKKGKTPCACPGSQSKLLEVQEKMAAKREEEATPVAVPSRLRQWPVQIKLAPIKAPYFDGAKLLIAADCTAYAYANFHQEFLKGKVALIGCPKLDSVDYTEKLTEILACNRFNSVTVVRMEVPCCGGIEHAVRGALKASGRDIPLDVITISTSGEIL